MGLGEVGIRLAANSGSEHAFRRVPTNSSSTVAAMPVYLLAVQLAGQ